MTTRAPLLPVLLLLAVVPLTACSVGGALEVERAEIPTSSATTSTSPSEPPSASASETAEPSATSQPTATTTTQPESSPEPDPASGPSTYAEAAALVAGATTTSELERFASPDGNLYCVLESPFSPPACELGRGAVVDPVACPPDGPSQSVGRIELTEAGPQPVCNSDTIREPDAPVLDVGSVATWPGVDVACLMQEAGVVCVAPTTERGYELARGRYQLF